LIFDFEILELASKEFQDLRKDLERKVEDNSGKIV